MHHELALIASAPARDDAVASFVQDGLADEDMVVAFLADTAISALERSIGPSPDLTVHPLSERPGLPAVAMHLLDDMMAKAAADDRAVRIIGEETAPSPWWCWRRYEAAVNLRASPTASLLCVYDERPLSDPVIADLLATHPVGGRCAPGARNPLYRDPVDVVANAPGPRALPCEATPPTVQLTDPSPAGARAAVHRLGDASTLDPSTTGDLALATSEIVTNAGAYGRPPVSMELWNPPGEVVVRVTDRGPGPEDRLLGLAPTGAIAGGLGLWIAHQLVEVVHRYLPDGFSVRLRATEQTD